MQIFNFNCEKEYMICLFVDSGVTFSESFFKIQHPIYDRKLILNKIDCSCLNLFVFNFVRHGKVLNIGASEI